MPSIPSPPLTPPGALQGRAEQVSQTPSIDNRRAGLSPIDKYGADSLFQIISQRYERGSFIIKAGETLDRFLDGFPTVSREQAKAFLEVAQRAVEAEAGDARAA